MNLVGEVRRPLFLIAAFAMLLVVLVEIGSAFLLGGGSPGPVGPLASGIPGIPSDMLSGVDGDSPPGSGIAKLVFPGFLVFSQQRFLKVVPLMIHVAVSFVLQLVLGLIHGFLPFVVVSIGDQLWALVTAVVAAIGALVSLIASIPAVVNALRVSASRQQ